ncbi:MAG TPA: hypothetical protein HA271_06335 [Methanobacterium subterraneum]|uniref:Uncharacterized protein n=1 Tax=Methanobacterium subterraneum TaxID=59277 RepID=A0A7J4TK63_9EURY|nr:hypothetical protein [Methanobacterium subterraneum]
MSCYLRHMKEVLEAADLHPEDKKERKEVDLAIRRVVGMKPEDRCNMVWKEVKLWLQDEDKKNQLTTSLKAD